MYNLLYISELFFCLNGIISVLEIKFYVLVF